MKMNVFKNLNFNEGVVLLACYYSSEMNGHDFGIIEDVLYNTQVQKLFTNQQVGGYLSALQAKGCLEIFESEFMAETEEWITQFIISKDILGE